MPSHLTVLLLTIIVLAVIIPATSGGGGVFAFGAGNIPRVAYLENKAFRHGDIEDVLTDLLKKTAGSGLFSIGSGTKFGGLDVKRVYFGNWLRDYSQAVDVGSLKRVQLQTVLNIVMVLGFMAHGYATGGFEVTAERLGTYLPVEHIDNPKGYGEGEDARKYHPKLRGPVDPIEYAVDPHSGMKNYIANEKGHWDTSKAHVRRLIEACISYGRRYRQTSKDQNDKFEAFRLLGSAMHTLEDFFAHSNFCELALISLGRWDVFPHVGERAKIRAPNGQSVYPIVTGTFGGSDFIHSLLGEATDKISQSSVSDLTSKLDQANAKKSSGNNAGSLGAIRSLATSIPGFNSSGAGAEMSRDIDNMERARASSAGKDPKNMNPQELRNAIWPVLVFRDNLVMTIEKVVEKIPGLQNLLDNIMDSITIFVLTTLDPFIRPLIKTATQDLSLGSGAVINNHDQYEVFDDPTASDPTHSFLSKDHFGMILNECAGNLAKIVVIYAVPKITAAWDNPSANVHAITEDILQCLFHPDWHNRQSTVQVELLSYMGKWMNSHGSNVGEVKRRLTKEGVRRHENVRAEGLSQGATNITASNVESLAPGSSSTGSSLMGKTTDLFGKMGLGGNKKPGFDPQQQDTGEYGAGAPPRRGETYPDSGRYGAPPPAPGPPGEYVGAAASYAAGAVGAAASYAPPPGPPATYSNVPTPGGGFGFPSDQTNQPQPAHHNKPQPNRTNWDDQAHVPGVNQNPAPPGRGGYPGRRGRGGYHEQPHRDSSLGQFSPPSGPPPSGPRPSTGGGSSYYSPPSGPPPSQPYDMPSFPAGPGSGDYGGYGGGGDRQPTFPTAGGGMPSASFSGMPSYDSPRGGYGQLVDPPAGFAPSLGDPTGGGPACPACTFANKHTASKCEMCETPLRHNAQSDSSFPGGPGGGYPGAGGGFPAAGYGGGSSAW
ncbi:hypothetical protein FRB96_005412 [Tulasnella sp. 330]|nr:hypothetical protein FRB96_005412 [Tulasnella sp. 330]KAG8882997.1 hypothetical protein FRB97_007370 [Tulasnella sp. 331]KAG8888492.1 hypothetical protein FRB98_007532 [Tulasnella sp. 332]